MCSKMNHKQIWTEIAEAFHTPEGEGTERQRLLARRGLCYAAEIKMGGFDAADSTYTICERLHSGKFRYAYCWFSVRGHLSHKRESDLIRGDMATLFACMTKKEFERLVAPQVPK